MTDVIKNLVILNRLPNGFRIPNRRLNLNHLGNQSPKNSKKGKNDNVVKYTKSAHLTLIHTKRNIIYE